MRVIFVSFLAVTLTLLTSCSRTLRMSELSGRYIEKRTNTSIFLNSSKSIELFPDSLFIYKWHEGSLMSGTTKGKWYVDGRDIILNSEYQPDNISFIRITDDSLTSEHKDKAQAIAGSGEVVNSLSRFYHFFTEERWMYSGKRIYTKPYSSKKERGKVLLKKEPTK